MTPSGSLKAVAGRVGRLFLLLLVCLYPVLPSWFDRRLPSTHEGYRYLLLSDWFRDAMAAGIAYPRWLPEMNGGFGYPEFVFYQPAYFFVNALTSLVAEPLLLRQLLSVSLLALTGGIGVYLLARRFVGPVYALLAVMFFQMAPYVHSNLYIRGDLSEWMALELVPWPVYFLLQACRGNELSLRQRAGSWLGLSLATAALCYSHPVALMFLPLLLFFTGGVCLLRTSQAVSGSRLVTGAEIVGAVLTGLALSSPYWLTVQTMKPLVNVSVVLEGYLAWKNTVPVQQLLFGSFIGGQSFREFLGAPFVLIALLGWWCGRKIPFVFASGLVYGAILIAMSPLGQLFWKLYPFSLLQFPWRLAVFAPLLQVMCAMGFSALPPGRPRAGMVWLAVACCLLLAWTLPHHYGFKPAESDASGLRIDRETLACLRHFARIGQIGSYVTTIDAGEWMPLTAAGALSSLPARGEPRPACDAVQRALTALTIKAGLPDLFAKAPLPRPVMQIEQAGWEVQENVSHTPFLLDYRLNGRLPATLVINQLYLPGWSIMLNGRTIQRSDIEQNLLPDGRMRLQLAPGAWRVTAWYDGPPGWRLRNWLIAVLCGGAAGYWACRWYALGRIHEH